MRYTISVSKKIYVGDRLLGEVFYSKEFDESIIPTEAAFQAVKDQTEKWAEELKREWSTSPQKQTSQPQRTSSKPEVKTVQDVARVFPADLASEVSIEEGDRYVLIKPKRFLGSDMFKKISEVVKDFEGGEYISAGKESHWRIPKTAASKVIGFIDEMPEFDPTDLTDHKGWKARKREDGSYAEGSLDWGWDFADNFPESVIAALRKGPLEIDQYVFSLNKTGNLVQVRRKRKEEMECGNP